MIRGAVCHSSSLAYFIISPSLSALLRAKLPFLLSFVLNYPSPVRLFRAQPSFLLYLSFVLNSPSSSSYYGMPLLHRPSSVLQLPPPSLPPPTTPITLFIERHNSEEDAVALDSSKPLAANVADILRDVAAPSGVVRGRKLGQLNNFVKIIRNVFARNLRVASAGDTAGATAATAGVSGAATVAAAEGVGPAQAEVKRWDRVFGLKPDDLVVCLAVGLLHAHSEVRRERERECE